GKSNKSSNKIESENKTKYKFKPAKIENKNNIAIKDFNDKKTVESNFLEEFSQLLDIWIVISAKKTKVLANIEAEEDNKEISLLVGLVGNIIYLAIDSKAK
ncbi:21221_t:CDS:1, partial [Racocetra persica]